MREPRCARLEPVGLVRPVEDEIDAEFALRSLDGGVGLALRHTVPLGEEFEMMNQGLHVVLHPLAAWGTDLAVVDHHGTGILAQPLDALADDAVRLTHLLDA